MPSIAEATRNRRSGERRRLFVGVALLGIGSLLVGVGAAGALAEASVRVGVVAASLVAMVSLLWVGWRAGLGPRERAIASIGAAVALVGLLVVMTRFGLSRPWDVVVGGLGLLAGLAVLLAAVLATVTTAGPTGKRDDPSTAWVREGNAARQSADGGEREDELSFPLEED